MEGEDEDSEEKGAFNNAKVWKRMIIIIAGAVMNILLGFVMMFAFTVQADSYSSTTISQFQPNAFTANTGLQTGDKIVEVNGYSIWNSRDLQFAISTLPYETVEGNTLEVYKEEQHLPLAVYIISMQKTSLFQRMNFKNTTMLFLMVVQK